MELEHSSKLKELEFREHTATAIRQEKRIAYLEILRAHMHAVRYWEQMPQMSLHQTLQMSAEGLGRVHGLFDEHLAEIELVATPAIRTASHR